MVTSESDNKGAFGEGLAVDLIEIVTRVGLIFGVCFGIFYNNRW